MLLYLGVPVKQAGRSEKRFMDIHSWLLAWDSYSLAAVAVEQMSFSCSRVHRETIMRLAFGAASAAGGRKEILAVIYDRLVRCVLLVASVSPCVCARSLI